MRTMAKDQRIYIRVTEEERAAMERATLNLGLRSISEAVRVLVQRAAQLQSAQHQQGTAQSLPDRQPDAPPQ